MNYTTSSPRMALRPLVLALGLLAAAPLVHADAATDGALAADHQGYKVQQDAIQAIMDFQRGTPRLVFDGGDQSSGIYTAAESEGKSQVCKMLRVK